MVVLTLLSGCTKISVPNVRVCTAAGVMGGGADCGYTLSDDVEKLELSQFIDFLEPDVATKRGGALCMAAADFVKIKDALEKACAASKICTFQVKRDIEKVSSRMERLQKRGRPKWGKG